MATGGALSSLLCCPNMGTRRTLAEAQDHERKHRKDTGAFARVDLPVTELSDVSRGKSLDFCASVFPEDRFALFGSML